MDVVHNHKRCGEQLGKVTFGPIFPANKRALSADVC